MGIAQDILREEGRSFSYCKEDVNKAFRSNYYHFKLLLYADRKALETMAEMEGALRGARPFGYNTVRAWCTKVSANVLQIIKSLDQLVPGKYGKLLDRFDHIRKQISSLVEPAAASWGDGPLAISFNEANKNRSDDVGPKMAVLGDIRNRLKSEVRIPAGFVVTTQGYHRFMEYNHLQAEINRRIQATPLDGPDRIGQLHRLSTHLQILIGLTAEVPEDLKEAIFRQYSFLEQEKGKEINLAVRSSAVGEGMRGISFAGQYRSELNVRPENILHAYKNVIASKYSLHALIYRLNHGIRDEDVPMCVGCMAMIDAVSGGVAYSRNPIDIEDDSVLINSVWGLPKSIVDGVTMPDSFIVSRNDSLVISKKDVPFKQKKSVSFSREGIFQIEIPPDEGGTASLTDEQVLKIAGLAIELETFTGAPQDIEWAIDQDGAVVLLQCRPLHQVSTPYRENTNNDAAVSLHSVVCRGGGAASPGVATGSVFQVNNDADTIRFPEGAVLVVRQSLPRWAALLSRAAAIVSEQGSCVGHLATVAREFRTPALFGVENATESLQHGRTVTVDADARVIYDGTVKALASARPEPILWVEASPVMETLRAVSRYITPLNLIHPEADEFKPESCNTYHDITRFCHEKVLEEMFRFATERRLIGRSGKRLRCDLPMTCRLFNLEDGFKEDVEEDSIELEHIASIPMLAFWRGMTVFPWQAPPTGEGKGLMSALLHSTTNRKSGPSLRSSCNSRNDCLIAKHFCFLQLRFNFHICTLESLVGEEGMKNYIIYHFKDGGDPERRNFRTRLVMEILELYGFRTEYKQGTAVAGRENDNHDFVEKRLEVVGYVTLHTRRLDSAMTDEDTFHVHKQKILTGIEAFMAQT